MCVALEEMCCIDFSKGESPVLDEQVMSIPVPVCLSIVFTPRYYSVCVSRLSLWVSYHKEVRYLA